MQEALRPGCNESGYTSAMVTANPFSPDPGRLPGTDQIYRRIASRQAIDDRYSGPAQRINAPRKLVTLDYPGSLGTRWLLVF